MNTNKFLLSLAISCFSFVASTVAQEAGGNLKKEVIANYAAIAGNATADALLKAEELKKAVAEYAATPSQESQSKAKDAWLAARMPYLQAEVFRMSDADAGALDGAPAGDGKPGGFHTIEFILWGKDESETGPGKRDFVAFAKAKDGGQLVASADLIVAASAERAAAWKDGVADNARAKLLALPEDQALAVILGNLRKLASNELAQERVGKPFKSRDQKDETSQFSDLTHLDLIYTCSGMANVVAGAYVGLDRKPKVQGSGLLKLAESAGEARGKALKLAINRVMFAVTDFRPPFDRALAAPDDSPAREAIQEMLDALGELSAEVEALAKALDVKLP